MRVCWSIVLKVFIAVFGLSSCLESIDLKDIDFEEQLVINAVITDELSSQHVTISKTIPLTDEDADPVYVSGAEVTVCSSLEEVFSFSQDESGIYVSDVPFAALQDVYYCLSVSYGGNEYISDEVSSLPTPPITSINSIPVRDSRNQISSVSIVLDTEDPSGTTEFLIWDWSEDFAVTVSRPKRLKWTGGNTWASAPLQPDCYAHNPSRRVALEDLTGLSEKKVNDLVLTSVDAGGIKARIAYGIQVRQRSISLEEYNYWQAIEKSMSQDGSFSGEQPGPVIGNIRNLTNEKNPALGYFSVSQVQIASSTFTPLDLSIPPPPNLVFIDDCTDSDELWIATEDVGEVMSRLDTSQMVIWSTQPSGFNPVPGGIIVVPIRCADCRLYGSTTPPDYF